MSRMQTRAAVTLMEIMIVLTIMSVSLLLALPSANRWLRWNDRIRLKSTIEDAIQQARVHAVQNGSNCRIRLDRSISSLKIEQVRDSGVETIKVIPSPKQTVIRLSLTQTGGAAPSIDIDAHGLFVQPVRIDVDSGGRLYSWKTDRSTGMITDSTN